MVSQYYCEYKGEKYFFDKPYKELVWEELKSSKGGTVFRHKIWRYKEGAIPCFSCGKGDRIIFIIEETGMNRSVVIARCLRSERETSCNITFQVPPYDPEENRNTARLIFNEEVSLETAKAIAKRIHYELPTLKDENNNEEDTEPIKDDLSLADLADKTWSKNSQSK
jgi:hypothetical protein